MVEFVITYSGTFGPDQRIHERQVCLNSDFAWTVPALGVCVCLYVHIVRMYFYLF